MPQDYVTDINGNILPVQIEQTPWTRTSVSDTSLVSDTSIVNNDGPWNNEIITDNTDNTETETVDTNTNNNTNTGISYDSDNASKQQDLVNKGYDLGNWGPNKDGVDGKWGTDSQKAFDLDAKNRTRAATDYRVPEEDLEWIAEDNVTAGYGTSKGGYYPKQGTKSEWGETWNSETRMWEDKHYAYDMEGNAISKEKFDELYGEVNDSKNTKEKEDLKWYQKIGVNNITDLIEAAAIIKTNRASQRKLDELKKLKVKSKKMTPASVQLQRPDYGSAKADISERGTAAVALAMREGKSVAEIQALKAGTDKALRDVEVAENEAAKEVRNKELLTNVTLKQAAQEFNLTQDRKDQVENNEIQAAALRGSIALYNQMRDAISTKIRDVKMLSSAEKQMAVFAEAISGGTGLDKRKLLPAIQYMLGNGIITENDATTMMNDIETLNG